MKPVTLLSVYLGFGALLAQQTTTERQAAREVIAKLESVERTIDVPGLVTRLAADDRDRDRIVARAKQLMESELLAMSDDITRHPEIGFKETYAVQHLTEYLRRHNFVPGPEVVLKLAELRRAMPVGRNG